jgi:hypothetical protein
MCFSKRCHCCSCSDTARVFTILVVKFSYFLLIFILAKLTKALSLDIYSFELLPDIFQFVTGLFTAFVYNLLFMNNYIIKLLF